jgi:hypothetical protein
MRPSIFALASLLASAGCTGPHARPKTLAGIGAVLAAAGGATWAIGDSADRESLRSLGFGAAAIGAVSLVTAGVLMAVSVGCGADADCPVGETCREVPAPPGGVPYAQCVPRAP